MNILVTGATGMFGKVLVRRLSKGNQVLSVSKSGNHQTARCDLANSEETGKLFQGTPFDLVIHAAAYSDVDGCELHPELAHRSNALAAKHLAENCATRRVPFIYLSTDYVFSGRKMTPYEKTDDTFPINIYGMTKLEGEHYARNLAFVSAVVRTSWLFGPGNPDNFVNAIARRLQKDKTVFVLKDQVDSPTYVEDLAQGVDQIGQFLVEFHKNNPKETLSEIFQFCNSGSVTRFQMALKIQKCLRLKGVRVRPAAEKNIKNRPALRPLHCVMSTRYFEKKFKTPIRSWQASLEEYLDEYV